MTAFSQAPIPIAYRLAKVLIVPRGASLPPNCVKCGAPAELPWFKKFSWTPPLLALLIFLGLIGLILYAIIARNVSKKMELNVPLCEMHHADRKRYLLIGTILLILCIPIGVAVGYIPSLPDAIGVLVGFAVFIASIVFFHIGMNYIRPKKIDDFRGDFTGASDAFLQLLPQAGIYQ